MCSSSHASVYNGKQFLRGVIDQMFLQLGHSMLLSQRERWGVMSTVLVGRFLDILSSRFGAAKALKVWSARANRHRCAPCKGTITYLCSTDNVNVHAFKS